MDLQALSLPDWLPWWGVVGLLVPVAFWLALFLLMPFSTFGLRGRLREMEMRIDALHEEVRGMTLRLPERGLDPYGDMPGMGQPPIPPAQREPRAAREPAAPRTGFGDPVADKMLAYMREKAQSEAQRAELERTDLPRPDIQRPGPRPRAEPRFMPPPRSAEPDLPPPPPVGGLAGDYDPPPDMPPPPRPPRFPVRFGRRPPTDDAQGDDPRGDEPRGDDTGAPRGWSR